MSTTTEAIEIIDGLVKAKIPKPVATKLVDFAEKQRDKSVDRLWIAFAILVSIFIGGYFSLSSKIDKIDEKVDRIDKNMVEVKTLLQKS